MGTDQPKKLKNWKDQDFVGNKNRIAIDAEEKAMAEIKRKRKLNEEFYELGVRAFKKYLGEK